MHGAHDISLKFLPDFNLLCSHRKIRVQKEDKFNSFRTEPQRRSTLAVISKLTNDIDQKYAYNKGELRKKSRLRSQLQQQPSLAGRSLTSSAPQDLGPSDALSTSSSSAADSNQTDFRKYSLPPDLLPGASFTLWPPRTFGANTALRLHGRSDIARSSTSAGSQPSGSASSSPQDIPSTRWEVNGPPSSDSPTPRLSKPHL
jgi:hypothetical protein